MFRHTCLDRAALGGTPGKPARSVSEGSRADTATYASASFPIGENRRKLTAELACIPRLRVGLVSCRRIVVLVRYALAAIAIAVLLPEGTQAEELFVATPVTQPKEFTGGIEGPATDRDGNIYAVNFAEQGTIGRVSPDGKGEVFIRLPEGSVGNGIRFDRHGTMFIADYPQHNVLKVDMKTRKVSVHAHEDSMNQPNDLTIAPDGTLYASDPNWGKSTGQIWRVSTQGAVTKVASDMGTTNGIEVSPDGKHLYVNESAQRNVWVFDIAKDGSLSSKRLLRKFKDHGFDGMRCDVKGNLYITRYGKGTVAIMSSAGEILKEVDILGARPSNLCFGGPDGRTVYVTEVEHTRLVQFRVEHPGLAWQRWQEK